MPSTRWSESLCLRPFSWSPSRDLSECLSEFFRERLSTSAQTECRHSCSVDCVHDFGGVIVENNYDKRNIGRFGPFGPFIAQDDVIQMRHSCAHYCEIDVAVAKKIKCVSLILCHRDFSSSEVEQSLPKAVAYRRQRVNNKKMLTQY